jgi:hypothetical protein
MWCQMWSLKYQKENKNMTKDTYNIIYQVCYMKHEEFEYILWKTNAPLKSMEY